MKLKRAVKWSAGLILIGLLTAALVVYWTSTNECDAAPVTPRDPMKAMVYCDYGSPDHLTFELVEKPVPADDEILVKVRAAALNPLDWHHLRGIPYIIRLETGLRKPKVARLGVDFAGTVEAIGRNVTRFKPGDDVFGGKAGAFAEYVAVREDRAVVLKPAGVSFEQAASCPIAATTALQALRDKGKVQSSQRVLINGASGGVGTFAVQIAKWLGADVTGVCGTNNLSLVRSIGADHLINYATEDFTTGEQRYDVIIDNVGNRSLAEIRRILNSDGTYVRIGGGGPNDGRWIGPLAGPIKALFLSPFVSQRLITFLAQMNKGDLGILANLIQSRKLIPIIDRHYPLRELPKAIRYLEEGHARGKIIITFD